MHPSIATLFSFQSKGVKVAFVGKDQTDEVIKSGVVELLVTILEP